MHFVKATVNDKKSTKDIWPNNILAVWVTYDCKIQWSSKPNNTLLSKCHLYNAKSSFKIVLFTHMKSTIQITSVIYRHSIGLPSKSTVKQIQRNLQSDRHTARLETLRAQEKIRKVTSPCDTTMCKCSTRRIWGFSRKECLPCSLPAKAADLGKPPDQRHLICHVLAESPVEMEVADAPTPLEHFSLWTAKYAAFFFVLSLQIT